MEIKKATTYKEQVELLKNRGCEIADEEFAKEKLSEINYYRLSAYLLPFKGTDENFISGTSFEKIYSIYEFDRKLRRILFSAIEEIEVYFKAKLTYFHALKYGPIGYLEPENFNKKHEPEKFISNLNREITSNQKVAFVRHHIEKYDRKFPLWVISELFTFGMISYFYNDLKTADKKEIAPHLLNEHYEYISSWLRCCTDLRNICAHYGRLYYRIFSAIPAGIDVPDGAKRKLWGAILSVKKLYPWKDKWNTEVLPQFEALFEEYESNIDLHHIAFPKDWNTQLKK